MRAGRPPSRFRSLALRSVLVALVLLTNACATPAPNAEAPITASGFIEGRQVDVASEVTGLIVEMVYSRGDRVEAGDIVVRLDDAALQGQRAEAVAALLAAEANLGRVKAGPRQEEIAAARARVDQAAARRDGAEQAVVNARDVIANPLDLNAQIDEARSQVDLAQQNVELHQADLEATTVKHGVYAEQGGDAARMWDHRLEAAAARLHEAQAQLDGARAYLASLIEVRDNPLALQAELHQAQTEYQLAEARVAQAQATLDELEAGPTTEELALAEAETEQARAGIALADVRLDQLVLMAPMNGIITDRARRVGETATAGRPLLTITNLNEVMLVIYVPVDQIGHVSIGQEVEVTVDSFPDRTFLGEVEIIAGEAEFTPGYVQTEEERLDLVFAVDVRIPNPEHRLKPGMPADAVIRPASPSEN